MRMSNFGYLVRRGIGSVFKNAMMSIASCLASVSSNHVTSDDNAPEKMPEMAECRFTLRIQRTNKITKILHHRLL